MGFEKPREAKYLTINALSTPPLTFGFAKDIRPQLELNQWKTQLNTIAQNTFYKRCYQPGEIPPELPRYE